MAVDREDVARHLRAARENRGLSQQTAAERSGLSRTVIAQIELGNRTVSSEELAKLASVYQRSVLDLLGQEVEHDDVLLMLLDLAPGLVEARYKRQLQRFLGLCREAGELENALGWPATGGLLQYEVAAPRNSVDAIEQGERIAAQERQRIGVGAELPAENLSALISSQRVRTFAADLPGYVFGLAVHHRSIPPAILVNEKHSPFDRRFSLAHEYAHAVFDRKVAVTKRDNSEELTEQRANAFAGAFLLPSLGVEQALAALNKGWPSRRTHVAFAATTGGAARAEIRSTPGSQTVTYPDVVTLACKFGAPYRAVVYRLLGLGMISEADGKALLTDNRQAAAREYEALFGTESASGASRRPSAVVSDESVQLTGEVVRLAIEAYRRQVINRGRLVAIAKQLDRRDISDGRFLELAEAAR